MSIQSAPYSIDRIVGCLVAGAIGDAAGAGFEGEQPPFVFDLDQHWFITDDTQLTLATCSAIVADRKVRPESIAAEFARAFQSRTLVGLGASTYQALEVLAAGGHWALAGRKGDRAAGNGAAMRAAPLAFSLNLAPHRDRTLFRDLCRITHHNDEAYAGALAVAFAIQAAWRAQWNGGPGLISFVAGHLPDSNVRDRLNELQHLSSGTSLREVSARFGNSAWVVESVPLALFAAEQLGEDDLAARLQAVIEIGGDTDTIASMAMQVTGCRFGIQRIPLDLITRLPDEGSIRTAATIFGNHVLQKKLAED